MAGCDGRSNRGLREGRRLWIGFVEELPGANTQGRTLEEARENLQEAVRLVVEANREIARRSPWVETRG